MGHGEIKLTNGSLQQATNMLGVGGATLRQAQALSLGAKMKGLSAVRRISNCEIGNLPEGQFRNWECKNVSLLTPDFRPLTSQGSIVWCEIVSVQSAI